MKLIIFTIFVLVGLAIAIPVADPQPKNPELENGPEEPQAAKPDEDLDTDATFWGYRSYYRPYYSGWRSYYRPSYYSGYGHGGYGGYGGWNSYPRYNNWW